MTAEAERLAAVRRSTDDLLADLEGRSDGDAAAPSLCTGWTRGHVLTHIARNADGIADTLDGALDGRIVERYPGGPPARNAAIDAGAARPYPDLVADVRQSAERLDRAFADVDAAGGWGLETAEGRVARDWLTARWKEVEIHRIDLDDGYSPDRWPAEFVSEMLRVELARLPERTDEPVRATGPDWAVLAWLVGRPSAAGDALGSAPELPPYN